MVEPGQMIGAYRVLRKLGTGGMGEVYEGVQEAIERHVAIKVLHPEYALRQEYITRFFNEARAVNRIAHPGLVQVSDLGQLPDKTAYIVMELLSGQSLGARLDEHPGPMELGHALNLSCQLADSLAAAHEKGIVHRDLKPDNVMVVPDSQMPGGERTKLLDFGIAKLTDDGGPVEAKTRTNSMMGTVYYMSPEQCQGAGKVDDRADVYSFGVMMFEMLTGERPFTGEGHGEIVVKQMMAEPPPLRSKAPSVPEPLAALVHRMLLKDKAARPSMSQVLTELEALRGLAPLPTGRASATLPVVTPASLARAASMGLTGTAAGQSQSAGVRRRGLVLSGVALFAALGLGGGLLLLRKPVARPPTAATPTTTTGDGAGPTAPASPTPPSAAAAPAAPATPRPSADEETPQPSASREKKGKPGKKGKKGSPAAGKPAPAGSSTASKAPAATKSTAPQKRVIEE